MERTNIYKGFDEASLRYVVKKIADETNWLLEIVNLNVENIQYVCAGDLRALDCLTNLANLINATKFDMATEMTSSRGQACFSTMIHECLRKTEANSQPLVLKRGSATIPLNGIDVPFHSSFFLPNLSSFRDFLLQNIKQASIDPKTLIGKYVPNVSAEPFDITREYFQRVHDITNSAIIGKILANWDSDRHSTAGTPSTPGS